jgi:hypothetical protein
VGGLTIGWFGAAVDILGGGTAQASRPRGLGRTGAGMFSAPQWPVP